MKDHRLIDERSLAFDRRIAAKVRERPSLLNIARENLERWLTNCSPQNAPVLMEWKGLLAGPVEGVLELLEATDERATRMRQSSPFCGILTEAERLEIIREFHQRESIAT